MATIAKDSNNVSKFLLVDSDGNLQVAEQGDWLPSAKGKTLIVKQAGKNNGSETIHTVTASKIFYLCSCWLTYRATADNVLCNLKYNDTSTSTPLIQFKSGITTTYNTRDIQGLNLSFPVPLPFPATHYFEITSAASTLMVYGGVVGWEE